jgi:hypothetical protein
VSPESMDSASAGGWSVRHTKMREVLGEASVDMQALQVLRFAFCAYVWRLLLLHRIAIVVKGFLQKLAWNGIPHNYRSSAWKIMLVSQSQLPVHFAVFVLLVRRASCRRRSSAAR